ncbi:dCMP deaminase [Rhodococcus phage ReqiPoco6]|uniref:Gp077 n=1 Tax=Rhodococcus phage ReqiPoco6 TaxID=691964 RepID=D4P7U5_9CAUD|nr:dCMP deaminase [Rhodococcus phage ReqiPoco6]ADD81075.1 gp077 [Rhodococcus phage ReqiPoco6]
MTDGRPSWDEYGMKLAVHAAERADCTRRQVGAVLMAADRSIISSGYNGGPSKGKSCLKGECPRGRLTHAELPADSAYDTGGGTCVALHAEWNVLLRTAWHQFEGSTLYITEEPCHICKVMISGTAIHRVVAPGYEWVRDYNGRTKTERKWVVKKEDLEYEPDSLGLVSDIQRAQHQALFNGTFPDNEIDRYPNRR